MRAAGAQVTPEPLERPGAPHGSRPSFRHHLVDRGDHTLHGPHLVTAELEPGADKDALIATVIAESFEEWVAAMAAPRDGETPTVTDALTRAGRAMRDSPDFVRLGLMLTLEHRPEEPAARQLFLETRQRALDNAAGLYRRAFRDLDDDAITTLTRLAMAIIDGLFIAGEAGVDPSEIDASLEAAGAAITAAAERLATRSASR